MHSNPHLLARVNRPPGRRFGLCVVAALAVVLAACGSDETSSSATTAAEGASSTSVASAQSTGETTGASAETTAGSGAATDSSQGTTAETDAPVVVSGEPLRIVAPGEPVSLNSMLSPPSDQRTYGPLYDNLVAQDTETGAMTDDGLLPTWKRVDDLTWLFDVRPGVTFSNGEVFDAAAAVFTIEQGKESPSRGGSLATVASVSVVGDQLQVVTSEPAPQIPAVLATIDAIPPAHYAKVGAEGFADDPIGTGPYVLDSYERGSKIVYKARPDYWGGTPATSGLEFTFSPEVTSRAALVESGQADLALDLAPSMIDEYADSSSAKIVTAPGSTRINLYMRGKNAFADERVRKAAQMAIDRESLVGALFGDKGFVAHYMFADAGNVGTLFDDTLSYDPDGAKALLDEVGGDVTVTLNYPSNRWPNDVLTGEAVAGMWEAVGFKVNRNPLPFTDMLDTITNDSYDAFLIPATISSPSPYNTISGRILSTGPWVVCESQDLDDIYAKATVAPDPEAASKLYQELEVTFVQKMGCGMPLYGYPTVYLAADGVDNVRIPLNGLPVYQTITKA